MGHLIAVAIVKCSKRIPYMPTKSNAVSLAYLR